MIRVYLPLGPDQVAALVATRVLVGPRPAYAVTAELEQGWPGADTDELEYAALMAAADASRVLSGEPGSPRWVIAADVEASLVSAVPSGGPGTLATPHLAAIWLTGPVSWAQVASAHVDPAAGADPDDDLAWFAPQEIADLL